MPDLVVICAWLSGSHWGELTYHGSLTTHNFLRVVGLVIPWNYPLMMLAWKMGACLAAGNTVILKPAKVCASHITQKKIANCVLQVTPLTALKFAELSARAGIPKGVINIVSGPGAVAGQVLSEHPLVRKMGFTGSTEVGKTIMTRCVTS